MMEYRGYVKQGVIVPEKRAKLKEGAEVAIRPVVKPATKPRPKKKAKTLLERLSGIVGKAHGLPSDYARNHDHYLHGQPKK